jgi:hypothetical protein
MPTIASVATSPRTSWSDAPAATARAASIPWVSGSARPTCSIQAGSESTATFAPQKTSRMPTNTFESTAVSRMRRPSAALISPSPVHEKASAIVCVIANRHGTDAYCIAFPIT